MITLRIRKHKRASLSYNRVMSKLVDINALDEIVVALKKDLSLPFRPIQFLA